MSINSINVHDTYVSKNDINVNEILSDSKSAQVLFVKASLYYFSM